MADGASGFHRRGLPLGQRVRRARRLTQEQRKPALGWLGAATVIVGAAIHVADSSIDGFGLNALASAWASAPASEQSNLLRVGDTLLYLLNGTWRSVHSYFHGVPFILSGSAVALSRRYPAWLGWVGVAGGTASFEC